MEPNGVKKADAVQEEDQTIREVNEFNQESNPMVTAQKQMATQETAGVLEQD